MEPDVPAPAPAEQRPMAAPSAARLLIWIAVVPALAITYYFGFTLPNYNRARLEVERQQVAAEQKRAELAAQDAVARKQQLEACLQKASDEYFSYLRLNGTESKDGKISASPDVEGVADQRRRNDRDSCVRQFGGRCAARLRRSGVRGSGLGVSSGSRD